MERVVFPVLGAPIDALTAEQAVERISGWARVRESRVVCICNAHSVVTAARDPLFMQTLAQADMATPDGAPIAWMLRQQGAAGQERITGPDLMLDYCGRAAATGETIFLYGSTPKTLRALTGRLQEQWPTLRIAGSVSPPFRELSAGEDDEDVRLINASGAGTVWVSLGCPKQERWMAAHRGRINAVMIGVGAAFAFHAGMLPRAPTWMRNAGLEWLHRLVTEPKRLWRRYMVTNTLFLFAAVRQLMRVR